MCFRKSCIYHNYSKTVFDSLRFYFIFYYYKRKLCSVMYIKISQDFFTFYVSNSLKIKIHFQWIRNSRWDMSKYVRINFFSESILEAYFKIKGKEYFFINKKFLYCTSNDNILNYILNCLRFRFVCLK